MVWIGWLVIKAGAVGSGAQTLFLKQKVLKLMDLI
jgi:hypothetical protein